MIVADAWTIQILDDNAPGAPLLDPAQLGHTMAEIEENLTLLLPAGYRARIRRWDHPDPDEGADDE